MFIDVVRPDAWEELNDQVKALLNLEPRLRARSYAGIAQAVFELSQSAAQFMSHKKAIGVVLGQTPLFDNLLSYYYKETYEVSKLPHFELVDIKQWVESLKKDTNFVLFSEDHPVTGEVYPFADELDRVLNEKRIYSFRVSHAKHLFEKNETRPYTVKMCSFSSQIAVAVLGERFRAPSLLAQNMNWDSQDFLQKLTVASAAKSFDPDLIHNFEKEITAVATPFLGPGANRLHDRALCVFATVSAEALATILFKKMGLSKEQGWKLVSTTNLCYWSANTMFRHWWQPAPTMEQLRGLLIFSSEILTTKDFAKLVISSYEELNAQQSWDL